MEVADFVQTEKGKEMCSPLEESTALWVPTLDLCGFIDLKCV